MVKGASLEGSVGHDYNLRSVDGVHPASPKEATTNTEIRTTDTVSEIIKELKDNTYPNEHCYKFCNIKDLTTALRTLRNQEQTPALLKSDNCFNSASLILVLRTNVYTDKEKNEAIEKATKQELEEAINFFLIYEDNPAEVTRIIHEAPFVTKNKLEEFKKTARTFRHFDSLNAISKIEAKDERCGMLVNLVVVGIATMAGILFAYYSDQDNFN